MRVSAVPCGYNILFIHALYCLCLSTSFIIFVSSNGLRSSHIAYIFYTSFLQILFIFTIFAFLNFFLFYFLLKKNFRFMIVKTNEIKMQIFDSILF